MSLHLHCLKRRAGWLGGAPHAGRKARAASWKSVKIGISLQHIETHREKPKSDAVTLSNVSKLNFAKIARSYLTISNCKEAWPRLIMPSFRAAARLTSIKRPGINGPLSLIRTTTDLLLVGLVRRTFVPKGNVLCAAVMACMSNSSPLAVIRP